MTKGKVPKVANREVMKKDPIQNRSLIPHVPVVFCSINGVFLKERNPKRIKNTATNDS